MDARARFRRSVRAFYQLIGAFLLALGLPFVAQALVEARSPGARAAGVAAGVLAWLPLIAMVARLIRAGDEFVRRLHFVSLSVAFAVSLVLVTLLDWLVRAGFLEEPPLAVVWLVLALSWAVSLLATKRYFERQA